MALVTLASLARLIGASGFVKMTAPLPVGDSSLVPTKLVAVTLAITELPQGRLNGAALREEIKIEQERWVTIAL